MNWVDVIKICKNILGCAVMAEEVQSVCEFYRTLKNMKNHPQIEVWVFKSQTILCMSYIFCDKIVKKKTTDV